MKPAQRIGQRGFVKATAGAAAMPFAKGLVAGAAPAEIPTVRKDNRITEENSRPGTIEWRLQFTNFDDPITLASYPLKRQLRSSAIEGFCSKNNVLAGDSLDVMVSMKPEGGPCWTFTGGWGITHGRVGDTWPCSVRLRRRRSRCR